MDRAPVELRVGGHTYRVVGSAGPDELQRLANIVDGRLRELNGSSAYDPKGLLLVAMALAHDLELERTRRREAESHSRDMLRGLLERVDAALELVDSDDEASPVPPAVAEASREP